MFFLGSKLRKKHVWLRSLMLDMGSNIKRRCWILDFLVFCSFIRCCGFGMIWISLNHGFEAGTIMLYYDYYYDPAGFLVGSGMSIVIQHHTELVRQVAMDNP